MKKNLIELMDWIQKKNEKLGLQELKQTYVKIKEFCKFHNKEIVQENPKLCKDCIDSLKNSNEFISRRLNKNEISL